MNERIKPYYSEIAEKIIEEFHRRYEEDKHFNLLQMLKSDRYEPVKYNIAIQKKGLNDGDIKAFKEKVDRGKPDGLQGKVLEDWLQDRLQTILDNEHEKIFDEVGITNDSPDEFGELLAKAIKHMNNPFTLYPHILYENMSLSGIEYTPNLSQYVFNLDKPNVKLNGEAESETERTFSEYSSNINTKRSKRLDSLENGKGFVIPTYDSLISNRDLKTEYDNLKRYSEEKHPHIAALSIGDYRDLLEKQLERQITVINELNDMLLDFLNLFYLEAETNFLEVMRGMTSSEKRSEEPLYDLHMILLIATKIHESFFSNRGSEYEKQMHKNNIIEIPYVDEWNKEHFIDKMETIFNKKKPILEVSALLIQKIRICESFLEGLLMDKPFKTADEFSQIFKIEQSSNRSKEYGYHTQNRDWIKKTFTQLKKQTSQNKAAIRTSELYEIEFGKSIDKNHVIYLSEVYP